MEDFHIEGKHYKAVQVALSDDCDGCAFLVNGRQTLCNLPVSPVPSCVCGQRAWVFVEVSHPTTIQD